MTSELRGTSSAERTLDARDLAAMRPAAAPKPRAPRKAANPALRQVTNGIVCFCGERFGEHQALEFMLHLRAEYGEDLALLERQRARNREYARNRKMTDPEWAKKRNEAIRKHRTNNPEYRERERRRRAQPEVREREREYSRERNRKRREDPDHRERQREYDRAYRARKKAERGPREITPPDPERQQRMREERNAQRRLRYAADPEYREAAKGRTRESAARKKAECEATGGLGQDPR